MPISLGEIELTSIQNIKTDETQALVKHRIPGLEGDIIQDLGRRPTTISFEGIFKGDDALNNIERLRHKFKTREPIAFVADISDSTDVTDVIIENMRVWEGSGRMSYFAYAISLVEYIETVAEDVRREIEDYQKQEAEDTQNKKEKQIEDNTGTLKVRLFPDKEDGDSPDYSRVEVRVVGTTDESEHYDMILTENENGIYTHENWPGGCYEVKVRIKDEGEP